MAKSSGGAGRAAGNERNPKIWNARTGQFVSMPSSKMLPDKIAGSKFFVSKGLDSNWVVSEFASGTRVGRGNTRMAAIKSFQENVASFKQQSGANFEKEWRAMVRRARSAAGGRVNG